MIIAVFLVQLDAPPGALDQGSHPDSTWRGIDSSNRQPPLLQVQSSAARAGSEIQDRSLLDKRQDLPVPPVPLLKAPEKPFPMHSRPRPATPVLQNKLRYVLAFQIVEQSSPEGVLRRIDHRPILDSAASATLN